MPASKPNFIRRSGAKVRKPGPFALDRLDRPVDRFFEAVDGDRDVDILGHGVARVGQRLVERADPDAVVALALEIEAFVKVGDERQVAQAAPPDAQLDHGAAARFEPEARHPGALRHLVAPRARGIDQHAGRDRAGIGLDSAIRVPRGAAASSDTSVRTLPP